MLNDAELIRLLKLSEDGAKQMQTQIKTFDRVMELATKNAPAELAGHFQKVQALTQKALTLHKEGRTEEANAVTEELKKLADGYKNN